MPLNGVNFKVYDMYSHTDLLPCGERDLVLALILCCHHLENTVWLLNKKIPICILHWSLKIMYVTLLEVGQARTLLCTELSCQSPWLWASSACACHVRFSSLLPFITSSEYTSKVHSYSLSSYCTGKRKSPHLEWIAKVTELYLYLLSQD